MVETPTPLVAADRGANRIAVDSKARIMEAKTSGLEASFARNKPVCVWELVTAENLWCVSRSPNTYLLVDK